MNRLLSTLHLPIIDTESNHSSLVDQDALWEDSDDDLTKTESTGTTSDQEREDYKTQLAKKETRVVLCLRLLVFLVLFLAAGAVCIIVYLVSSNAEEEEYRTQFEGAANILLETFLDIAKSKLGAVSSLGVASVANDAQTHWPFRTFSNFHQRAATARKQSGSLWLHLNPIVTDADRSEWETYVVGNASQWVKDGVAYQENVDMFAFIEETIRQNYGGALDRKYATEALPIFQYGGPQGIMPVPGPGPYMPIWQMAPVLFGGIEVNKDVTVNFGEAGGNVSYHTGAVTIGQFHSTVPGGINSTHRGTNMYALLISVAEGKPALYKGDPLTQAFFPVFDSFHHDRKPVAIMTAWLHWLSYFQNVLPSSMRGIHIVLHNSCTGPFTYEVNGQEVIPLGQADLHDPKYDSKKRSASFASIDSIEDGTKFGLPLNKDHCLVSLDVYPSLAFHENYRTTTPVVMTAAVASIFFFAVCMFVLYDHLVERRQALVVKKAVQSNAVVTSLFPAKIADRLMNQSHTTVDMRDSTYASHFGLAPKRRLKGFLDGHQEDDVHQAPLADLFPCCSVLFADIAGFTSWSSTRDPSQVFILLQTLYQAFDNIAKRRKVFKVETIGDCYVAVTGLPEPQAHHALLMARFVGDCKHKMNALMPQLESTLGPDTAELSMRYGIHSGPVTAGVLRGDRVRFQLFGDTVNTAARMESTGVKNMIQVSQSTHNLLVGAGKAHWLTPRKDCVNAKGKGLLKTYWLNPCNQKKCNSIASSQSLASSSDEVYSSDLTPSSISDTASSSSSAVVTEHDLKRGRLVDWIVELLQEHLRKLVATRPPQETGEKKESFTYRLMKGKTSLDEVAEAIVLPRFSAKTSSEKQPDWHDVELDKKVLSQLHQYVDLLSKMYRDNPFHNFEHACHVTMATHKFLQRIVAPDINLETDKQDEFASQLHNYTHGIHSDPLALLAIILSALIHDADHRGVSNMQMALEEKELALKYRQKSIAEQNSLDLAWDLLMADQFEDLRNCLFTTEIELKRFRQVLVNVVLATDIFDKELNGLRKKRWEKAFSSSSSSTSSSLPEKGGDDSSSSSFGSSRNQEEENQQNDLKATIVIEHIIQASDVSHTMQHWHIYRKWNKRLFRELSLAYREGRMGGCCKDPKDFWYRGEIGFYDNYIIPLAKKLKDCQVFGVSSDECLNYAQQNREEWIHKGQQIVAEMVEELELEREQARFTAMMTLPSQDIEV